MRRLTIDFAKPSLRRTVLGLGGRWWLLCALLLVLTVTSLWVVWPLLIERERVSLMRDEVLLKERRMEEQSAIQQPEAANLASTGLVVAGDTGGEDARDIISNLNMPWQAMLDALESATPSSTALVSLETSAKTQLLKLTAEAKSMDAGMAYFELLRSEPMLANVTLIRQEVNEQDPNKPIRFQFEIEWSGTTR